MHITRLGVGLATVLLLAACSSARSEGGSDAGPDTAPDTGAEASSTTPTDYPTPEEPEPVDPCSLLPARAWHPLVDAEDRREGEPTPSLESDFGPVARCRVLVGVDGATAVSWGYWLRPLDLQAVADEYGGTLFDGMPGQAFGTHTLASTDGYAVVGGGQGFTVSVPEEFSFTTKGRTPLPLIRKTLATLIRHIDYDMQRVDIDLPDECPAEDDANIRRAIGEVTHARGGLDHDARWCDYVNDRTGASISAEVEVLSGPEFEFAYTFSRDNKVDGERWIDPPPGPFTSAYRGEDSWSYDTLLPKWSTSVYVQGNQDTVGRTRAERRGAFGVAGFEAFGRDFSRTWSRQLAQS